MLSAGESITDATRLTEATVSSLGDRLQQEAGVIEAHRALAGQVEKQVLPALERVFARYTEALEEQSRRLQDYLSRSAEKVKHTVERAALGFKTASSSLRSRWVCSRGSSTVPKADRAGKWRENARGPTDSPAP